MTKRTIYLLGIIISILVGTYFYITCCSECGGQAKEEPEKEVVTPVAPKATAFPLAFSDQDYAYSSNDNFNFDISSSSILMPLAKGVDDGVASLKTYLERESDKQINITGYYTADEQNDSGFPDLGLARANSVKNHLVSKGISSKLINTGSKLMNDLVPEGSVYLGPLAFGIEPLANNTDDELNALYNRIKDNPLSLQFNTAESSIHLSAEQRQKIADISRYLDKVDDAKVNIVGHTDNTGTRAMNIALGQDRAEFAKAYLMQNGIAESKIKTSSKGPDQPIATNDTEEGRAKNRRTIITLN